MNGNGIQPTVELATTNGSGYYPVVAGYGNNNGFFGGDGIWALVLLALLFGNGGWGGGFGGNNLATTDFVSSEFTQRDISQLATQICNGFQNQSNLINNGFSDTATNLCNVRSDILTGNMGLQNSILDTKYANQLAEAQTQRDILLQTNELNNNLNIQSLNQLAKMDSCCCDLKAQGLENTQRILDALNNNTIQDLRDRLQNAETIISNQNVVSQVRPYPIPSYIVSSPYSSIYNPYGYGFNNGFYGNTII